jgi:hypothetical protein
MKSMSCECAFYTNQLFLFLAIGLKLFIMSLAKVFLGRLGAFEHGDKCLVNRKAESIRG